MSLYNLTGAVLENRAIILYENAAHINTIHGGTPGRTDWPQSEVTNDYTYGGWWPDLSALDTATIIYDFGASIPIDCLGMAAHNLGTSSPNDVIISASADDVTYTEVARFTPVDDSTIMALIAQSTQRYIKIDIEYPAVDPTVHPIIGVIKLGNRLTMPRGIYGGHSPVTLSRVTMAKPLASETGQFIGRTHTRRGFRGSYAWSNLDPSWYRSDFDPFVSAARYSAFFLAWRPHTYSDEVVFAQTPAGTDISPTNNGRAGLMDVSVPIEAYDWEAAS